MPSTSQTQGGWSVYKHQMSCASKITLASSMYFVSEWMQLAIFASFWAFLPSLSKIGLGYFVKVAQLISEPTGAVIVASACQCLLYNSPLNFMSAKTLSATLKASIPAGTPQYDLCLLASFSRLEAATDAACSKVSRISTSLAPLRIAPRTCVPSSVHLFRAVSIDRLSRLRVLSSRPGRVQMVPQADSCHATR